MKSLTKLALAGAIVSASWAATPAMAEDGGSFSANAGLMSDYYFRGVAQNITATTNGGVDYENGGFYAGTWAADVEDGLEVDFYTGYGIELEGGFSASIGYTGYFYTGDFDSEYNELNLNFSYGIASLEYSKGTHEKDSSLSIAEADYDFTALTLEHNGFFAKYGTWGDEFDGDYWEVGYGTEVGGFDVGVSLLKNDKDLDILFEKGDEQFIFTLGKSFDL